MDAIWMLEFARNIVSFRVSRVSVAEKSWLTCATVAGVIALPSIPVRFARALELRVAGVFFSFLVMLCYCFFHVLRYFVQWNWCIKAMCSTVVCCKSIVLCNSVCADRSGMAASKLLEAYLFSSTVLRFWLWFASPWRKSYCSGCEKVATGALAASFSPFWRWWFSFQFFFQRVPQNRRFSAWASRSGLGVAICVAVVRDFIVLCNSVSADRSEWLRQGSSLLRLRA